MRWDDLFDDLAGQGDASDLAQQAVESADRARYDVGRTRLVHRLRDWRPGAAVTVGLPQLRQVSGPLLATGRDWLALLHVREECLVAVDAIRWIKVSSAPWVDQGGAVGMGSPPTNPLQDRLGLTYAARCLARDRAVVRVLLVDGETVAGTVDRACLDHLELAQHPVDEPRRSQVVQASWWIPFTAVAAVFGGQVWSES